jgi:rhamnose utilization protein RhaD (predicted bifunctional aldolase and dehydrogenase)
MSNIPSDLLNLSRELGSSPHEWSILGEGNTSANLDDTVFLVKASGSQLGTLTAGQLVGVRFAPILDALDSAAAFSDAETSRLLSDARIDSAEPMPSVETLFHADLLNLPGINFVGHTHIISINSLLCSKGGWDLIQQGGRIFPDEVVVCGVAPCSVGYADPGLQLALAIRSAVKSYIARYTVAPKTIYLQNHGFIALGATAREVLSITRMADKAARILIGTMSCGGPNFMSGADIARILNRPDEHLRQRALGLTTSE